MNFSKEALDTALTFFLGDTTRFDKMDKMGQEFFLQYVTDCNSSSVREAVTLHYLNYQSYSEKHGADGYDPVTNKQKEVKPRMIKGNEKLKNVGNFNDMTMELIEKKKDFDIICSLFHENRLVYIVEFPFHLIRDKISRPVLKAKAGKRVVCHFSWKDFDDDHLVIHYLNKNILSGISGPYKNMLITRNKV